jgi:hypothetical protein
LIDHFLPAFLFNQYGLLCVMLTAFVACRSRAEVEPRSDERVSNTSAAVAQPRERDITVPPPDVDLHVINGRNILSAPLGEPAPKAAGSVSAAGNAAGRVRVTFWTTPDGSRLPEPEQFEGGLAELDLGLADLPMLSPGQKRRIWIPSPTGMATLDVELLR